MKKLPRAAVSLGFGAAMFVGAGKFVESISGSPEVANQQVEACARQLGQKATRSAVIPKACDANEGWISAHFDYTDHITNKHSAEGGFKEVQRTTTYELPSADQLRDELLVDPVEERARTDRLGRGMGGLMSPIFTLAVYQMLRPYRPRDIEYTIAGDDSLDDI